MIYVFIFRSNIEQEKGLHSMQIDVQISDQMLGARPSSVWHIVRGKRVLLEPYLLGIDVKLARRASTIRQILN